MTLEKAARVLAAAIGADKVATDEASLHERRHDYWAVKHLRDFLGQVVEAPGMVVRPHSVADVQAAVTVAGEAGLAIMPFGLGSGVCGGIEPTAATIILDMGAMNRVREINLEDGLASFDAGVNGLAAEARRAVLHEGALRLEDWWVRRSLRAWFDDNAGLDALAPAAAAMGALLGWDDDRRQAEIDACRAIEADSRAALARQKETA